MRRVPAPLAPIARASPRAALAAIIALAVIAAAGPLTSGFLDRAAAAEPVGIPPGFTPARGCPSVPEALRGTAILAARAGAAVGAFACATAPVTLWIEVFPPATAPKPILLAESKAMRDSIEEKAIVRGITVPGAVPPQWPVVAIDDPPRATAAALWIAGRPAGGLSARFGQAWRSLSGGAPPPVLVVVESAEGGERGIRAIEAFLEREPGLGPAISRLAASASRPSGAER